MLSLKLVAVFLKEIAKCPTISRRTKTLLKNTYSKFWLKINNSFKNLHIIHTYNLDLVLREKLKYIEDFFYFLFLLVLAQEDCSII